MKKRKYLIIVIFLILGFLIFNKTLSELKPIPKVTFKSQNLNYDKKEPGSFKVDKSAKWIGEGKAKVTIEVNSVIKEKSLAKDIIFVLDVSGSMSGDKLNQVKKDTTDLATAVLSNRKNRVALITFDSRAERVSDFTNNKAEFLQKVNSLTDKDMTNYKAGFDEASKLLEGDKVTWNLGTYRSGTKATLEIELDQVGSREEFYKTNKGIDIKTIFEKQKDDQISRKTPVLKDAYKVIYEGNSPQGCTVKDLEKTTSHKPFENVQLIKGNATCDGYLFQGYELITDAKYINQDYIDMPEKDVIFRATWTKAKVNKGMQGKVVKAQRLYDKIKEQSLGNDKAKGIDYSKVNSLTNGEGVYLFDETKNDTKPVYFFRGTHNLKNNLLYANLCWKIVRTTETGGVRIVYNGSPVNGKCTNTTGFNTQIGSNAFNANYNKKQYVGYMYGDDTNPYQNTNDSDIKKYIDNWYKTNIKDKGFESSLDKESIYCGDRTEGTDKGSYFQYAVRDRAEQNKLTLKCPLNDSYSEEAGNRKLTNPVALLSSDEVMLAGGLSVYKSNGNYYLYTGNYYRLLSPSHFYSSGEVHLLAVSTGGSIGSAGSDGFGGVRPVVTVAPNAPLLSGDGSQNDPYII